jgi:hypothetical protein
MWYIHRSIYKVLEDLILMNKNAIGIKNYCKPIRSENRASHNTLLPSLWKFTLIQYSWYPHIQLFTFICMNQQNDVLLSYFVNTRHTFFFQVMFIFICFISLTTNDKITQLKFNKSWKKHEFLLLFFTWNIKNELLKK